MEKNCDFELTLLLNSPVLSQFMLHCLCYTKRTICHLPIILLNPKHRKATSAQLKIVVLRKEICKCELYWYHRYIETKWLLLPRDKLSNVYPKLCQSTINADRLSELAHFTATKVGTEGGFYISKDHERQEVKKDFLNRNETGQG